MHSNIVLAALFAGSQIAAAAVAYPRNWAVGNMPGDGQWSGPDWGWGSYPGQGYGQQWGHQKAQRKGHSQAESGNSPKETGSPQGSIGKNKKQHGNYPQGYIGKHKGHRGTRSSGDDAPGQYSSGHKPSGAYSDGSNPSQSTVTFTVTYTDYVSQTHAGHAPSHKPSRSKAPSSHAPSSKPGHGKAAPAGSGNAPSSTNYQGQVLQYHNVHRANHSAPALTWSEDLAQIAQTIASSCVFAHNLSPGGGGYGQNIAAGTPPEQVDKIISNEFYNGEEPKFSGLYGLANPPMSGFEGWGHFTQLVWKDTSQVGCATVHCPNGVRDAGSSVKPYFTVCNYKTPGNVAGEYAKNVGKPLGHPKVGA